MGCKSRDVHTSYDEFGPGSDQAKESFYFVTTAGSSAFSIPQITLHP